MQRRKRCEPRVDVGELLFEVVAFAATDRANEFADFFDEPQQRALLAARAVGLDCGPMSGFDAAKVDAEFFPDGRVKTNFICSIGHGDPSKLFDRSPRFGFDEVCRIA